ncbi:hypothetical protein ACHAW5_005951 [Stephanodiscus triporus]|uniref:Peptidase M48 domain-containing protein n=1 Tax=Stephanodiscus triporus TaxID=2934178 RepID=A0ABD3NDY3_9STRA
MNFIHLHIHTVARHIGLQRRCHLRHSRRRHSGLAERSHRSRRDDGGGDNNGGDLPPPHVLLGFGVSVAGATAASVYAYRSCLDNVPYTNRSRLLATSPQWEANVGHEQYSELLEMHRGRILPDGHRAAVTVRRVGSRIAAAAERCSREWTANGSNVRGGASTATPTYTYTVIRSEDANAFVLPGNHVFVLTGLFRYVRDEDELASVLGHEMAHNLARHAGERASETILLAMLRRLALVVDPSGTLLALLIPAGALLCTLPHSREHEMEADRIGMILAGEACYDPRAAGRVFSRMRDDDGGGGVGGSRNSPPPEWISTHPGYDARLSQFDRWMPEALERFNLDGGSKCRSIREEMKRARRLAAEIHDGQGRRT